MFFVSKCNFKAHKLVKMDDRVPVLSSENSTRCKKLNTVPHFSIHLLISTIISVVGIVLASTWPETKRCEAYFIMLYMRGSFYVISWIFDCLVKWHHEQLRLNGYHDFHREMKTHHKVPMQIVNLWNSALLAVTAGLAHYYGPDIFEKCSQQLGPTFYVVVFNATESLIFFIVHGTYITKVVRFNNLQLPPDALRGSVTRGELGLVHSQSEVNELLEKQSDLIEYLRDHVNRLNQKLQQLSNQLRTVTLSTPHPAI